VLKNDIFYVVDTISFYLMLCRPRPCSVTGSYAKMPKLSAPKLVLKKLELQTLSAKITYVDS